MSDVTRNFNDALAALESKNLRRAEELFKQILAIDKCNVRAMNLLVVILISMQRFAEAETFIARATSLNQSSDVSFYNYGLISKHLNKHHEALQHFTRALHLNPNVAETWNGRGTVFSDLQKYDFAVSDFDRAILLDGRFGEAYANKGMSLSLLNRHDEALAAFDKALSIKSDFENAWVGRGNVLRSLKRHDESLAAYGKALSTKSDLAEAWLGRGNVFVDLRRYDEASVAYDKALSIKPDLASAWVGRGNVLRNLERYEEAFADYDRASSIEPNLANAWVGRGNVLWLLKRYDEALAAYDKAVSIKDDLAEAWLGRGNALADNSNLKRHHEAVAAYDKALLIKHDLAEAWLGRGNVLTDLRSYDEALVAYDRALSIQPDLANAWLGRGNVFWLLKRYDEALAAYDNALSSKDDLAEAWLGRGNVLTDLRTYQEALVDYDRALSIKPDLANAWLGRGNVLANLRSYEEALVAYDRALSIKPDLDDHQGDRLHVKMHLCDWKHLDREISKLGVSIKAGKAKCFPFKLLSLTDSPDQHLRCAQAWMASKHGEVAVPTRNGRIYQHDRIHIGYVSGDFREHAVAFLTADLFESHDKSKFKIAAFSFGPDDSSAVRQRLVASFDQFVDCWHLSDGEIARMISDAEIDILINLQGLTQDARTGIFAPRPAPIQVNYLGYPGTMGAPFIDYVIGDNYLFTPDDAAGYSEKLVWLPYSYQPNDRKRVISDRRFDREECGLPRDGFVFCCFNNNYKITPSTFDAWARILRSVDGSVLWLHIQNRSAIENLKMEAERRGVDARRLVFASRVELLTDHLARHRLADLFLDTLPYNAHTTASDALWAGVPVLTQMGNTFAGRVGASLLCAVGLPELITRSREEYEELAIELAREKGRLRAAKEKLVKGRLTAALFDTPRYTKHLEAAYEAMYLRHSAGLPPDHIEVDG
jgi:protein O-GlcNAc transferase